MPPSKEAVKEITLQLFVYDLQEGLGQKPEAVEFNRYYFWRRFDPDFFPKVYDKLTPNHQDKLREYAQKENSEADIVYFESREEKEAVLGIECTLAAYQLADTYSLIIDAYDSNFQKTALATLKEYITKYITHTPAKLGQTWLLWGQLDQPYKDDEKDDEIKTLIAQDCYLNIAENNDKSLDWKPIAQQQNRLLGGCLFEISQGASLGKSHYLIWLLPHEPTLTELQDKIRDIQTHFHRLFCYRHKITFAYGQSRILKHRLKDSYQTIQDSVLTIRQKNKDPESLQAALEKTLEILGTYATDLSQLHSQLRTITINLANYQERLEKLKKVDPNCQLTSLAEFADFAEKKYQRQVKSDYESLSPGMTLLENLITTISGVVEINQAKREKRIERAIAAAGIGVGTASAAASSIANYAERIVIEITPEKPIETDANTTPIPATIHPEIPAGFAFIISCLIGVAFGSLTWWRLNWK
jgi:hypothetical protein